MRPRSRPRTEEAGAHRQGHPFGSYARGGWVDEPHTAKGHQSDYNLLIIVNLRKLTDRVEYRATAEDRLNRELAITKALRTQVNFIVHTMAEVTTGLSDRRYFPIDIDRDGSRYQSETTDLPKPKTPEQALAMAREYFDEWLPSAEKRFAGAKFHLSNGNWKDAAFDLHQTADRNYHCVLLVCTFYTPLCRARHMAFMPSGGLCRVGAGSVRLSGLWL